ncbi:MAG TPA: TonB-dependent receptor, partial [Opitutus sp.]|nr:TonB-dependent receptor [Opitutus sp.]
MNTPLAPTKLRSRARLTMKLIALLFGMASTALAQTGETGVIAGYVVNETTAAPLQGAAVTVEGSERFYTLTGPDGSFRFTHVPAGERVLVVEYTGLTPGRTPVTVIAGEQSYVSVKLASEIYSLEAFTVSTVREGQAAAINEQRHASNVVSVVSTDAYGNVADTNLGNLLLKLPGISAERDEAEAYQVTVRGINADLNSVSVDGTLLAGATSRGSGRAFEVDKVSTNSIESIEVIKSPTPDMDADSIGGKINLRTKSGFDTQGRRIRYSIGSNIFLQRYRNPSIAGTRNPGLLDFARAEAHPSASFNYSDVLGKEKRVAIVFNASFNRTFSPRTALRLGYEDNPPVDGIAIYNDFQTTEDDILLDRLGLGGKLTFKLSPNTTLFVSALYNDFNDEMSQHKFRLGDTDLVGTATDTVQDLKARSEYEMETRTRTVTTGMLQIGGRTDWRDYAMDYDLSHSKSYATDARKNLSIRHQNVTFRIDSSASDYFPTIEQIGGPDVADYDHGKVNYLDRQLYENWDDVTAGKFNIQRSFNTRFPTYLKTGFRYRAQEKSQDRMKPRWAFRGLDNVSGFFNGVNDDNLNRWRDDGRRYFPVEGRYQRWVWPDTAAAHQELDEHPERFIYNAGRAVEQNLKDDHTAGEKIYATYLMGSIKTGKLSTVAGLRFERTETYGTNPSTDESYPNTDPRRWAKSQSISGGYNNTFPGLHLRYEVSPKFLLRASASTSIGRPSFTRL